MIWRLVKVDDGILAKVFASERESSLLDFSERVLSTLVRVVRAHGWIGSRKMYPWNPISFRTAVGNASFSRSGEERLTRRDNEASLESPSGGFS